MSDETITTGTCICGNPVPDVYPYAHRSFCSGHCAARAASAVKVVERARDFLAGYILAQSEPDGSAGKVLKELLAALADVRKGPGR